MVPPHGGLDSRDHDFFRIPLPRWLSRRMAVLPLFWRFQIIGWLFFAVLSMPLKISAFNSIPYALLATLLREPAGFLITCGFRLLYLRLGIRANQAARLAGWVICLSFLGASVDALFGRLLDQMIRPHSGTQGIMGIFCFRSMLFCCWSFLYFWLRDQIAASDHQRNLAHAKAAAQDAELLMLRAQVSPHFLFNSFNTILAGLERQPLALIPVVQGLADYFRYSLTNRHDALVPLGEEFDAIVNYLRVEKARFRESLLIESRIDDEVRSLLVPGVFLQPLVENALKYGHQTSPTPLRLEVSACSLPGGGTEVVVTNSGEWIEPPPVRLPHDSGGHGLAILKRRLHLLYAGRATFDISSPAGETRVSIRVRIPAASTVNQRPTASTETS